MQFCSQIHPKWLLCQLSLVVDLPVRHVLSGHMISKLTKKSQISIMSRWVFSIAWGNNHILTIEYVLLLSIQYHQLQRLWCLGVLKGGNLFRTLINEDASSIQFLARVLEGFCALVQFFWCRAMLYVNKERKLKGYVAKNTAKKLSTCVFFWGYKLSDCGTFFRGFRWSLR